MRDIREDLKERLASITTELDDLKKRENLLTSIQQSLFGLLEEEDRRFRDRAPLQIAAPEPLPVAVEPTPNGFYSESTPNGLHVAELSKAFSPEFPKSIKVSHGSWADIQRTAER